MAVTYEVRHCEKVMDMHVVTILYSPLPFHVHIATSFGRLPGDEEWFTKIAEAALANIR